MTIEDLLNQLSTLPRNAEVFCEDEYDIKEINSIRQETDVSFGTPDGELVEKTGNFVIIKIT